MMILISLQSFRCHDSFLPIRSILYATNLILSDDSHVMEEEFWKKEEKNHKFLFSTLQEHVGVCAIRHNALNFQCY